jgi:hypothetical protein
MAMHVANTTQQINAPSGFHVASTTRFQNSEAKKSLS